MEWDDLLVETSNCIFVRAVFKRVSDSRKEILKASLVEKFVDKLVYIYERREGETDILCTSIVSKTESLKLDELKIELEQHFKEICNCDVSKSDENVTFYSPKDKKDINSNFASDNGRATFEVKGTTKNLSKFFTQLLESTTSSLLSRDLSRPIRFKHGLPDCASAPSKKNDSV